MTDDALRQRFAGQQYVVMRTAIADPLLGFLWRYVLARAERLTWSDGSLGCAEAGHMYTQMLVAGFRVVAKTSAGELTYHTDSRGRVVSCLAGPAGRPGR